MTLEEKLKIFKEKGWTCNPDTGEVFSHTGKLIVNKSGCNKWKYINCKLRIGRRVDNKSIDVKSHQLIMFICLGYIYDQIDHINGNTLDNRLINLRGVNQNMNQWNRKGAKGYYRVRNKYRAVIKINNKKIHLGYFDTELEARQAYLDAKKIYHII